MRRCKKKKNVSKSALKCLILVKNFLNDYCILAAPRQHSGQLFAKCTDLQLKGTNFVPNYNGNNHVSVRG